jgi:hypothetical protein
VQEERAKRCCIDLYLDPLMVDPPTRSQRSESCAPGRCRWAHLIKEAAVRLATVHPGRWFWRTGVDSSRLAGEGRERRQHGHGGTATHVGAAGAVGLEGASCWRVAAIVVVALDLVVLVLQAVVEGESVREVRVAARVWEWKGRMSLLLEADEGRGVHGVVVVGGLHHHQLAVRVHCLVEYPADHPFLLRATRDSANSEDYFLGGS